VLLVVGNCLSTARVSFVVCQIISTCSQLVNLILSIVNYASSFLKLCISGDTTVQYSDVTVKTEHVCCWSLQYSLFLGVCRIISVLTEGIFLATLH
jgi:hypothetical protein